MEPWNAETTLLNQSLGKTTTTLSSPFIITILWYCITMEKIHPLFMGKSTISMAMFNSYVTNYQRVIREIGSNKSP